MRLPIRRSPFTRRPSACEMGGCTVRNRNALVRRILSSGCPTRRGSSAAMYAVMSGNSGMRYQIARPVALTQLQKTPLGLPTFTQSLIDSPRRLGVKWPRSVDSGGRLSRTGRRVGVVLFQLGGPETLEAIEPFLYNLFCDPDIIDFPFARLGRKPLARLISATRARKVQHHYQTIGGGSPIRRHTEQQARALEAELRNQGMDARCFVAMRYWHPFTAEAIEQVRRAECDELVLLPLYPQYSSTTTGSSLNEWRRLFCDDFPVHHVESFYRNELYLDSVIERVNQALSCFPSQHQPEIIFSAHSIPLSV